MLLINFKNTAKQSFVNGLLKGMAAPVVLYGTYTVEKLPHVKKIVLTKKSIHQSLASDWYAVRSNVKKAAVKYGETQKTSSAK